MVNLNHANLIVRTIQDSLLRAYLSSQDIYCVQFEDNPQRRSSELDFIRLILLTHKVLSLFQIL